MEIPHSLATDSFSYSWLQSHTHTHPNLPEHSTDFDEHNFIFDVPASDRDLVHADQIFSGGRIKPAYAEPRTPQASTSLPATPLCPSGTADYKTQSYYYNLGRWRRSSKKVLQRCFRFVNKTFGRSRTSSRVDDLQRKVFEVRSWSNSVQASPRTSSAAEIGKNWRTDSANISPNYYISSNVLCDSENSINEAILYCKRSVGL